jgi:hypothetical protein
MLMKGGEDGGNASKFARLPKHTYYWYWVIFSSHRSSVPTEVYVNGSHL